MKYYEENSAAMSEDENLDVESDVMKHIFLKIYKFYHFNFLLSLCLPSNFFLGSVFRTTI
jgi:hypothetical protein